ncbi:hypothetical protein HID58_035187 [Brassica napus]|uniref:Uncharacterized protein n=2 Tax=Brassica TaxID=3705 RepID=A0A8D9CUT7_BRACM|nr:hypothetical protein HID58_035187 [Brassica napus]CAF2046804.1 unnamed protein product [Brassica napus]CAG7865222.1 unnamed protein product [Brassica rapa]
MEGLIPFLYKAMVMYKREGSFSSVLLSDHHSHQLPVTTRDFLATPPVYFERQTSGDLGPTVLDCLKRRLLHHLACPLGTSRNVRMFKYVLPRFSNCSEDSEGSVLIAGSYVHGSKSNLKTAAKREGSHIESLEAAIYEGTVNEHRHSDSIKKVKTENSG